MIITCMEKIKTIDEEQYEDHICEPREYDDLD